MAFQLKTNETLGKGVKRVVRQQIDKALDDLKRALGTTMAGVHDARRRLKKVRAVLRLARNALGSRRYQRENDRFRDAGRPLTEVRDATALLEALEKLAKHSAGGILETTIRRVRQELLANREAVHTRDLERNALSGVRQALKRARSQVRRWDVRHRNWTVAFGGLKRVYRLGYHALGAVVDDRSTKHLHEWRKQAKYLWHQLQLLEGIRPKAVKPLARRVHTLTQYLGDDHDLAILRRKLEADRSATHFANGMDSLFEAIETRRDALQRKAVVLGRRIYRRPPKAFKRKIERLSKA